jgi:hypothetical protein
MSRAGENAGDAGSSKNPPEAANWKWISANSGRTQATSDLIASWDECIGIPSH